MTSDPAKLGSEKRQTAPCRESRPTINDGHYCALLDGRWTFETICIYTLDVFSKLKDKRFHGAYQTSKELALQTHGVEGISDLIVVTLDLGYARGENVSLLSFAPTAYRFVAESVGVSRLHSGISSRPFSVAMFANLFYKRSRPEGS